MTKTLKQILEGYEPRSGDEKRFIDKHIVVKHADRNGNGDDVFKAKKTKYIKRKEEGHGHDAGEDHLVYEDFEDLTESLKSRFVDALSAAAGVDHYETIQNAAKKVHDQGMKLVNEKFPKGHEKHEKAKSLVRALHAHIADSKNLTDMEHRTKNIGTTMAAHVKKLNEEVVSESTATDQLDENMGNALIKKEGASHETSFTVWPGTPSEFKSVKVYHTNQTKHDAHIRSIKKKYGASNVVFKSKKLNEEVESLDEARGDVKRAAYEKLLTSHGYKQNDRGSWQHPDGQRAMHLGSGNSTYLYHSVEGNIHPGGTYKHNNFDAMGPLKKHLENLHGKPTKLKEEALDEGQDLQYGRKPKVVTKNYSWGKMKTIHKGADFSIPMHPEHHEPISKLSDGESHHFTDETRTHWTATRSGDDVHFQSSAGKVKVPHKSLNEEVLDEAGQLSSMPAPKTLGKKHTTPEERSRMGHPSNGKGFYVGKKDDKSRMGHNANGKGFYVGEDTNIQEVSSSLIGRYLKAAKQDRYERFTKEAPKEAYTPKGKAISAKWKAANAESIAAGKKKLDSRNDNIKKAEAKLGNK